MRAQANFVRAFCLQRYYANSSVKCRARDWPGSWDAPTEQQQQQQQQLSNSTPKAVNHRSGRQNNRPNSDPLQTSCLLEE